MHASLAITVHFDLICPWCLIGRHHLRHALDRFSRSHPEAVVNVEWLSYPLLPEIPAAGLPYQSFYERRLGGPEAVAARRAQVREAGRRAGVEFAFERIRILPNTRAAHRLIEFAARRGGARSKEGLIDALFEAYFLRGEDIGDDAVLSRIAADFALGREEAAAALRAADVMPEATPWRGDVSGVPFYRFNDRWTVSGAQPPEILLPAMRQALEEAAAR